MAVKIRFSRVGRTKRAYFRIVVADARKQRDGACLEMLGTYDPVDSKIIGLDLAGIKRWIALGAQCSDSVKKVINMQSKKSGQIA